MNEKLRLKAKQLKADIPAVFISLGKKHTPITAKIIAAVTIVYALSPVDLIPDFIPVLGFLDDVILLPGLVALVIKLIPADVFTECRRESENLWNDGKPKKWYYALPVVIIWGLLVYLVVKMIWL